MSNTFKSIECSMYDLFFMLCQKNNQIEYLTVLSS